MGPKKKGKGSKLARMSEEERIRYMQHRAAIEEEARRRKEQLIATYMKNKLKHEEAFMRLNSAKINQQWRHLLRKVKCKELKDNMKILWTTFEGAVRTKNKVIQTLLSDLEEAEIQYSMMLENHMQVINRLIGLHQARLQSLNKSYSSEKAALLDAATKERANTSDKAEFACEFLQTVIYDMNTRNQRKHKRNTTNSAAKQDELRNQMQSEIEKVEEQGGLKIEEVWRDIQQVLKSYVCDTAGNRPHYNALQAKDKANTEQLLHHCEIVNKYTMQSEIEKVEEQGGLKIEEVWRDIQQVLKSYVCDTAGNRPHYNALQAKDKANTEQLLHHCEIVNKYTDSISELKHQMASMHCSQAIKLRELKEEQSDFLVQLDKLRQSCSQNQAKDEEKLTTLAVTSSSVIKDLTKIAQKGETILQMASTCQKFLSENEKLKNYNAALRKRGKEITENEDEEEYEEGPLKEMDNFWQQYNEVVLECEELSAVKNTYAEENKQLRKLLRQYLNSLVRPTTVPRAAA